MGLFVVSLSDVGEGVAEAELIEWHVAVGDTVAEDQLLGVVMTDKAAVDVPSSVLGKVIKLCADVGDIVAVGADLIHLDVDGAGNAVDKQTGQNNVQASTSTDASTGTVASSGAEASASTGASKNTDAAIVAASASDNTKLDKPPALDVDQVVRGANRETDINTSALPEQGMNKADATARDSVARSNINDANTLKADANSSGENNTSKVKVLAAPSVRQRSKELGVELSTVVGSGPAGRIMHADLDQFTERRSQPGGTKAHPDKTITEVKVVGMRRKIAEKMALSKSRIPHITIVEEVDVQYLEELRTELNQKHTESRGKLTILPFVMKSIIEAVREQPEINARYDDEAGSVAQHASVHIGIATQTPAGLVVPVVKHSEVNSLWDNAGEVVRLANACRDGTAGREDLGGSTITITSLGPLGAVATTPIINHPEVAIVGINKMMVRPFWDGQQFVPRKMMNLSCSFDHRVVDGWDAAVFVQKLKSLLEKPAMLFLDD